MKASPSLAPHVLKYARRLSVRLWSIHALRGLCLAAGTGAIAILIASSVADPILTRSSASWVWGAVGIAAALGLFASLLPLRRYRGAGIARVVESADPALSHRMRSALELVVAADDSSVSRELLAAHLNDVQLALEVLPERRVLPWSRLFRANLLLGLAALAVFAIVSAQRPALRSFVRALLTPAQERSDGTRIAKVVTQLRVQLTFPSYLARDSMWLSDPDEITVPAGTNVEFRIATRFPAERGKLFSGSHATPLTAADDGTLRGRLSALETMSLHVELESRGVHYEDPRVTSLKVTADEIPSVSIEEPRNGTLAPPTEALPVRFVANDDVGVVSVSLFARAPDGSEKERQIFSAIDDGGAQREVRSSVQLVPAELGVREGDTLVIWLEARDADLVSGPHVAKSREVTLEVAQPGRGLSALIPSLQQIADSAVDLLGDRLENAVPKDGANAKSRFSALERLTKPWLAELDALTHRGEHDTAAGMDLDQLRGMRRRNDHLLSQEAALHGALAHAYAERAAADGHSVDELERDVVLLADMLARAHVDEAKAIADELRDLKRHIESLLDQLGKTHSPEAERELMREIAKAQRRLAELAQSLSRMATRVPGEFVNRDAMQKEAAESSLTDLERAVQNHDLRAAAEHLDALAKQIDDLAAQLGQGGLRLQESRFGPRDQALAEARQKLNMLGTEQNRLAERSGAVAQGALERAQAGQSDARARSLAPQAEALEKQASALARQPDSGWQSPAASRAAERMHDAKDALRAGDLAEARGMAESAQHSLQEAASELESESRMFPGHHGESSQRAEQARRAADDADRLSQAIDRAMPEISNHVSDADRQKMRSDAEAQRKTGAAAEQLKKAFDKGPDGLPLSPEAVDALEAARQSMQRAEHALDHDRPDEANREQQQAAERIQKLSQSLAQKQSGGAGQKGGKQESASGEVTHDVPVHIPGAEEWKGPTELRRKLLDAMHEGGPSGYEAAIQRYYQELMR
ncbi:MAG TPA: DUF4175 family protein [Polyangiales bacterium]